MHAIVIPSAPVWMKVIFGIPLALVALFGLRWGGKNLWLSGRILGGSAPAPSGSTEFISGSLGLIFHSVVIAAALGSAYFFCALVTTQPTLITDAGVVIGARPPKYQSTFLAWTEVTSVECGMPPRSNTIRRLVVRSSTHAVELGNAGAALEPVREFIQQHTGLGTVRPCKHEVYDHKRSY